MFHSCREVIAFVHKTHEEYREELDTSKLVAHIPNTGTSIELYHLGSWQSSSIDGNEMDLSLFKLRLSFDYDEASNRYLNLSRLRLDLPKIKMIPPR